MGEIHVCPPVILTVVVVDDYKALNELLVEWLQMHGYEAIGLERVYGIDDIRDHKPSLVILDYQLPFMTGSHILNAMRQDEELARVPVILLTGDSHLISEYALGQAQLMLKKPFGLNKLLRGVTELT